ncbi:hypothetical protein Bca4012_100918 [Brassica carinata]
MDMNSVAALFVATVVIFVFLLCLVATIHVFFIWGIVSSRLGKHIPFPASCVILYNIPSGSHIELEFFVSLYHPADRVSNPRPLAVVCENPFSTAARPPEVSVPPADRVSNPRPLAVVCENPFSTAARPPEVSQTVVGKLFILTDSTPKSPASRKTP